MYAGYLYLIIAIISEIIGSNMVVSTEGFTKLKPTLICSYPSIWYINF
nr:SMR family transporter [Weissella sagaensis]